MTKQSKYCATCGESYDSTALFCPKDGTPLGSNRSMAGQDPFIGLVIGDQIELRKLIGAGSMGRVYKAFQRGIDRDVAVKILHRNLAANESVASRFLSEARIASKLTHPHVVQVLMAGQLSYNTSSTGIGNAPYIVMEYLDGISLMSLLAAMGGAMPLARSLRIVLEICDAVGTAHEHGIIHRDIKPENVMLVRRGDDTDYVKVLDFGIAHVDEGKAALRTEAGLVFGTAQYISPEGALGEVVTASADVYSIATVLYQCLSGQPPFVAPSATALLLKHAYESPPALSGIPRSSYVPSSIADVIMTNLSKFSDARAQNAHVFGKQLLGAAVHAGLRAEDLVRQSTLLGHPSTLVSLTSMQRTNQMRLSLQTAQAIDSHAVGSCPSSDQVLGGGCAANEPNTAESLLLTDESSANSATDSLHHSQNGGIESSPLSDQEMEQTVSTTAEMVHTSSPEASQSKPCPAAADVRNDDVCAASQPALSNDKLLVGDIEDSDLQHVVIGKQRKAWARYWAMAAFAVALVVLMLAVFSAYRKPDISYFVRSATIAMNNRQWNSPSHHNVNDLTLKGLELDPNNAQLLELRKRSAQELLAHALGKKYAGDLVGALNDARLAVLFAPSSVAATNLVRELEMVQSQRTSPPASASEKPSNSKLKQNPIVMRPEVVSASSNRSYDAGAVSSTHHHSTTLPRAMPSDDSFAGLPNVFSQVPEVSCDTSPGTCQAGTPTTVPIDLPAPSPSNSPPSSSPSDLPSDVPPPSTPSSSDHFLPDNWL